MLKPHGADSMLVEVALFGVLFGAILFISGVCGCVSNPQDEPRWKCIRILHGDRSYTPEEWKTRYR
jgi:hypothetical protein